MLKIFGIIYFVGFGSKLPYSVRAYSTADVRGDSRRLNYTFDSFCGASAPPIQKLFHFMGPMHHLLYRRFVLRTRLV